MLFPTKDMADQATLDAIETGELILQVDGTRGAADPFKRPAPLQALTSTRLSACKGKNAAVTLMEGSTVGAAQQKQEAFAKLSDLLHNGYNGIGAVASDDITDAERAQVYASYGWEGGLIGDMSSPSRVEHLANTAITATADAAVPAQGTYSATLISRITNWLGIYDAAAMIANGGSRQVLIQQRNDARDLLQQANSRVRLAYCSASDDGEGKNRGHHQLSEPRACVVGVREPGGAPHVVVTAEPRADLHGHKDSDERHQTRERQHPFDALRPPIGGCEHLVEARRGGDEIASTKNA